MEPVVEVRVRDGVSGIGPLLDRVPIFLDHLIAARETEVRDCCPTRRRGMAY